jgi:hypothetical protein
MRFCYCDESGTGSEPIAVMVGIVVDTQRMHLTKEHWVELIEALSKIAGRQIAELHTRDFYSGNGIWRSLNGSQRSNIISAIFQWLQDRKHKVVYSAVLKEEYYKNYKLQFIPDGLNTIWRFMGFHVVLAMQKCCQREPNNKGHTLFVFDNEERERLRFTDLIKNPPAWSGEYYGKKPRDSALNQVVDVPLFADSEDMGLIQLADVAAFFLRRYAEIHENLIPPQYFDEQQRVDGWVAEFVKRSIGGSCIYMKSQRGDAENLFYNNAPPSIRRL